jgi:DNA-binding NtrC family response regulator
MTNPILVVEDDRTLNRLLVEQLTSIGYQVHGVGLWTEVEAYLESNEPGLIIMDGRLPDANCLDNLEELVAAYPVIVLTAYGSVKDAVIAMRGGAADYLLKPLRFDELQISVERALENAALRQDHQFCRRQLRLRGQYQGKLIGHSDELEKIKNVIRAVAMDNIAVLIQGESGSGKELVAQSIHALSPFAERNFVTVDCCTLQSTLFESELFGHEKGAFTGADKVKKGLIEGAEGGTLFLDEIGEIDATIQAKLLRVLETGTFRRVGGNKDLQANVRFVSATNRNLEEMIGDKEFRADLFFRLNGFSIEVPALRERRDDIEPLANHFIKNHSFSKRINKKLSKPALRKLIAYDWPGNIRELKNVVERAIILSGEKTRIDPAHIAFGSVSRVNSSAINLCFDHDPTLEELQNTYLELQLKKHSGRRSKVAEIMGISERSVYRLINRTDPA